MIIKKINLTFILIFTDTDPSAFSYANDILFKRPIMVQEKIGMNVSGDLIDVLKNFSKIQKSIFIEKGSILRTINSETTIAATAQVQECFSDDLAIYELEKFINVLEMYPGAQIDFGDDEAIQLTITHSNTKGVINYTFAALSATDYMKKDPVLPTAEIKFHLPMEDFLSLKKVQRRMGLPHLKIIPNGMDSIDIVQCDFNKSTHDYKKKYKADREINNFAAIIDLELFKCIIPAEYEVKISSKGMANFSAKHRYNNPELLGIDYWIKLNSKSVF